MIDKIWEVLLGIVSVITALGLFAMKLWGPAVLMLALYFTRLHYKREAGY